MSRKDFALGQTGTGHVGKSEILFHLKLKYKIIAKKSFFVEQRHLEEPRGNTVSIILTPKKKLDFLYISLCFHYLQLWTHVIANALYTLLCTHNDIITITRVFIIPNILHITL